MKKTFATILLAAGMAGACSAATLVNYTASGDPNVAPDATATNGTTSDIWQCAFTGNAGSGFYPVANTTAPNDWDIFTYPGGSGVSGTAMMTYTFEGDHTLDPGQKVSILYAHNTNIAAGTNVGIELLSASGAVQTEFLFTGGGSGTFTYADTGSTGLTNPMTTNKGYDPNDPFTVSFTMTSTTAYTGSASNGASGAANSGNWSGSVTSPIAAIAIVNLAAGDSSDQWTNNLAVTSVPEPTSLALLASGGVLGGWMLRRRRNG